MSTAELPVASWPIASAPIYVRPASDDRFFDIRETVLSQYANSPILLEFVDNFSAWLDPLFRFDSFFRSVWDIDTAVGHGLDVWGRILGVGRVLQVPAGEYFGFEQQSEAKTFGFAVFYSGSRATNNATLTDDAYRKLLIAKAALNITDASIPAINRILLDLFDDGYVRDDGGMSITYVFDQPLSPVETAIVYQSGVLPTPAGVTVSVEVPA